MKRVLVLDANQRSSLAVTRSLGKYGITVFTADDIPDTLSGCSHYAKKYFVYPSPRLYSEKFVDVLTELVKEQQIDVLLPMTELTTTLLLNHKEAFPKTVIPFPDLGTVDTLADKCSLMRMAESLNVPIPRTYHASNPDSLPCALEELAYPVVLKPGKSWLLHNGQWINTAVQFANNPRDAEVILTSDPAFRAHSFMIQEYIPGYGQGIFALYNKGEPLAFFAHRRLREKPPSGGVSVVSESIAVDPELRSHAHALLTRAAWHGIAMVEFRVALDGTPYLMEINTRFWRSLQLAIDAGVDFPSLLYELACDKPPDPIDTYKTGIRLRWLLGDLDSLYLKLRDRRYSAKEKLQYALRFLTPSPFKTRHEIDRWGDMGPFRCEMRQYVQDLFY